MSHLSARQDTYALVAELPVSVDSYSVESLSRELTPELVRHTSVVTLAGGNQVGVGEDALPFVPFAVEFQQAAPTAPLAGEWTVDSFSSHLATLDLFPTPPPHPRLRCFRQWAFESAALDLALRQAGTSLAAALGRTSRPVTFVNSMHLADPPSAAPIRARLELFPGLRFKLDPTGTWGAALIDELAALGAVDTVDLKGQYPPQAPFAQPPNPELYARVADAFPDAWIEDPATTPESWEVLSAHRDRVTWDAPIWSVADIEALPYRPLAINMKPVRFGTVRTLFDAYDHCAAQGIATYGGGFGELGPGRHHLQYLASLFHPDMPNDVAPSGYNRPRLDPDLPASPLRATPAPTGFRWDPRTI